MTKVRLRLLNTLSEQKMFVVEFVVHHSQRHDPDPSPKPSLARKGQGHPPSEVRLGPWPHRMVSTIYRGGLRGGAPPPLLTNREAAIEWESMVNICFYLFNFVVSIRSTTLALVVFTRSIRGDRTFPVCSLVSSWTVSQAWTR